MKKIIVVDGLPDTGCAGPNFFAGGVERHNYILCKILGEMGYDVHTIQITYKNLAPEECFYGLKNVTQHFINPSFSVDPEKKNTTRKWNIEIFKKFQETVRSLNDAVFAFNNTKGRYSRFLCELGIPTVQPTHCSTIQHGGLPGSVDKFLQTPRFYSSDIFKFGYISEFVKRDYMVYAKKYLEYEITEDYMTEYIGALSEFKGEIKPEGDYFTIISRCNPIKKPHIALNLAVALKKELHFYTVIQDEEYYEKRIKKYENYPNIKIFIDQPHDKILENLQGSRALIMTAKKETFGIVGVEALERGVPIIYMDNLMYLSEIFNLAPQDALVAPSLKKMIIKSSDEKSLKERMSIISFSLEERKKIAKETRKYFSEQRWVKNLKRIIAEIKKPNNEPIETEQEDDKIK